MKKNIAVIAAAAVLAGCASLQNYLGRPSIRIDEVSIKSSDGIG